MKTGKVIYLNPPKTRPPRRSVPGVVLTLPTRKKTLTERIRNDNDPFPTRCAG